MMNIVWLLLLPLIVGLIVWPLSKLNKNWERYGTIAGLVASIIVAISLSDGGDFSHLWFSRFQIYFSLYLDDLALILIILTFLLAIIAVMVSWHEIKKQSGLFHFNLMFSVVGIVGVFLARDLFLFFFFWEVMLLPMTALIAIWGHEEKYYAATKFFIFTQLSSLLMLVSIIALALIYKQSHGVLSFDFETLQHLKLPANLEYWLMLGFFIAFAVKLPSVPFHTWLPDAHTQAPTAGSVLLAGVLLKTGAYGLIRFIFPLFPNAALEFAPIAAALGVISILYGAVMAFSQTDFKRLVAYSSISHMGFVMLAVFSMHAIALKGAIMTMIAHGLSSAALFCIAGMLQQRLHSRTISNMGGIWKVAPKFGVFTLCFMAAAVGLPGMANFVGEFLSLVGSYKVFPWHSAIAAIGLIGSAIYGLYMFQGAFQGPVNISNKDKFSDLDYRELLLCYLLVIALIYLGLFPDSILGFTATELFTGLSQIKEVS